MRKVFAAFCAVFLLSAGTPVLADTYDTIPLSDVLPESAEAVVETATDPAEPYVESISVLWPRVRVSDLVYFAPIARREAGLEISGRVPVAAEVVEVFANTVWETTWDDTQAFINAQIEDVVADKIADARDMRARTLSFAFDVQYAHPVMSVIIKSTAAHASSRTHVASINFDVQTGILLSAGDVVGSHVVQLADRLLIEMIRRNPEHYNPSFVGMSPEQAFSVTNREIVFLFNEFQLSSSLDGIETLALRFRNIREITLEREEFHIRPGFNLKMVPLKHICLALGYNIYWNEETGTAAVFLDQELIIELRPGVNNYQREPQRFTRSLEAAPEIIEGAMYVPISFFDQILSLTAYRIDDDDVITFVSYLVDHEWFER